MDSMNSVLSIVLATICFPPALTGRIARSGAPQTGVDKLRQPAADVWHHAGPRGVL